MAESELKLLGMWASPFMMRVRMVLEQKGLNYQYLEEDLSNKSELLLKHNPIHEKVPVLIHGDRGICESLVVLQYIDETWSGTGPPVLPADPYERAMARFWADYIEQKLLLAFIGIARADKEEERAEKFAETMEVLEHLEGAFKKCSGGKDFFGGDFIGFVDVTLGSLLTWIKAVENFSGAKLLDETKFPLLVQWVNRFLAVDFVKFVLPSADKLVEQIKVLKVTRWKTTSPK